MRTLLILFFLFSITIVSFGQTNTWDGSASDNWNTAANWSLNLVPTVVHDVVIPNNDFVNVNTAAVCNTLTITGGNRTSYVNVGNFSLQVTGSITVNSSTQDLRHKYITVNSGSLSCASIILNNSNDVDRDSYISITNNGSVTVSGNITMNGTNNSMTYFLFTGAGTLNIGGNISGGGITSTAGGGTNPPTSGTVNYNNAGNQTIGAYTYYNLSVSNGGTKALAGNTTVSNTLNISSGVIQLADYYLNLSSTNAISGSPFNNTKMVETDGAGYLILNAAVTTPIVFPVGSNSYYSPVSITSISETSGTISARTVYDNTLGSNYLPRYWDILTSAPGKTISVSFAYDALETTISPTNAWFRPAAGAWTTPTGTNDLPSNPFTITGTTDITNSSTHWTAGLLPDTYFSYQTGDWNKPSTWTHDPGGTTRDPLDTSLPGDGDVVVILPGRTVTLTADTTTAGLEININSGGILNLDDNRFTAGLASLNGTGTLQLASTNFPTVPVGTNTFVQTGGGTTEYLNSSDFQLQASQATYNNLTINVSSGVVATQLSDIVLNGNLLVKKGTYRINNDVATIKLNLSIAGNVTVNSGAGISVGQGVTNSTIGVPTGSGTAPFLDYYENFHRVVINGNFTNNGTVNFTNLQQPLYDAFPPTSSGATSGAASVYFQGNANSTMLCNGETDFYNLVLDKGTDQTYKLIIQPSSYNYFRIFGANTRATTITDGNPNLMKALWIYNGTLELKGTVVIPSLTEGTVAGSEYYIPQNGALFISGSSVIVLNTADDYREADVAYGVSSTTGVTISDYQGMVVYGKLQVNSGYLSTRESAGLLYAEQASGQFEINGGVIDAKQFRTYDDNTVGAAYRQTGGTFILRGRFIRPVAFGSRSDLSNTSVTYSARAVNGTDDRFGTFNLQFDENIFSMSGGTIKVYDASGTNGIQKIVDVYSTLANSNVSGGTIEILPQTGTVLPDFTKLEIYSKESTLGNLIINRGAGCATYVRLRALPLTILQNFSIISGDFRTNGQNITIGGNLTVSTNGIYNADANTTFNGSRKQTFTIDGTINNGNPGLENIVIDRSNDTLKLAGTQPSLIVQGTFDLNGGVFADGGKTVQVAGNITNSGIHSGSGEIQLNGIATQTIGGSGSGIFQNLDLNNTTAANNAPVSLIANTTIKGDVTFTTDKSLDISSYNVILDTLSTVTGAGTGYRYFRSNGDAGDGGLTYKYPDASAYTFHIGAPSTLHANADYTPAIIGFTSEPITLGSITVIPVGYEHPATTVNGQSLTYFWRVKSSGFSGIASNSITHTFQYSATDIVGTEGNYIPALYNGSTYTWLKGTNSNPPINTTANTFTDWTTPDDSRNTLDADYTAGDNAFGTLNVYYSLASGLWSFNTTWTFNSSHTGSQAGSTPGSNDIVVIGNNHVVSLYNDTNYPLNTASVNCASLQIDAGSTLDIGNNSSSVFSMVVNNPLGNGTFRLTTTKASVYPYISTFIFPAGDFTDFEVNQGTEEFYTTTNNGTALYILPQKASFGNMVLSPLGNAGGGDNMVLPNVPSVIIYGDLTINGTSRYSAIGISWNTNDAFYANSTLYTTVEKTLQIKGDLNINGGSFTFYDDDFPQHLVVDGDVNVAATNGANIIVWDRSYLYTPYHDGPTLVNTFAIGGSLNNNGVDNGNFDGVRLTVSNNRHFVDVTFQGSSNEFFTGVGNTYLHNLTINKGTSQDSTLTCDIGGSLTTQLDNWLTLQNGTFKYMRNVDEDFTISVNTPFTIPTTAGLYIDYTTAQDVLIANTNSPGQGDNSDVFLDGKLTIINGNVYIGQIAGTTPRNNDIEYSGSGESEIDIQGGSLMVNGQIRRNPSVSGGVLKYSQSNGSVTINGQNATTTNAKFEVCNTGSEFNMSGGTLTLIRGGGGTTNGDLYIHPHSSSVTGGTIILQPVNNITAAQEIFIVDASCDLFNFTINGFDADDAARVSLSVNPLVLKGDLTLSDGNSYLNTNNINVILQGDFINNGLPASYNYGTNTTTFNGNLLQELTGTSATNFNNLIVNPLTSLTLNNGNDVNVNGNLTLSSGTLICGNWAVNLNGNLTNSAAYTDSQYGIIMNGTLLQTVGGLGNYATLEIDNTNGVKAITDIALSKDLVLTNGILNIDDNLLSLSETSNIGGSGFGTSRMIITNGAFSDKGISKVFGMGASSFTYHLGVSGKYTPAVLTVTTNDDVGTIRVNNINSNHPTAVFGPDKVLQYYWDIESSAISNFDGDLVLNYLEEDVLGTETDYFAAHLLKPGTTWSFVDNVDDLTNIITFNYTATDNISGEYTAGDDDAFPDDVPVYTSNKNGVWNDNTIWTHTAGDLYTLAPGSGPNGFIVIIDDTVTTDDDYCQAYRTTINGTFRSVSPYIGHNLGTVDGSGVLYLESQVIPAGSYSAFFDCSNTSILEYGGTGNYTLLADLYDEIPNIKFSGTGTRTLPDKDLTICNLLDIDGPTLDNSVNNRKLTILGDMVLTSGAFNSGNGSTATVSFAGSTAQNVSNFNGTNAFNNLEIDNSEGLTLDDDIDVAGSLLLTDGLITSTSVNILTITNPLVDCITPEGGSASSYVNGPLIKRLDEGIDNFQFPIGNATTCGNKLSLRFTEASTLDWTVYYVNPNDLGNTLSGNLTAVNDVEYWNVQSSSGSSAKTVIKIAWDPSSNLTPLMTENGIDDMRVAKHNGTNWVEITSAYTIGSDEYNGSAETTDKEIISTGDSINYTLACVNVTKPRIRLAPTGPVCGDEGIPIELSVSNTNYGPTYTIYYTDDGGVTIQTLNPLSFPATLPTAVGGGTYQLTGFTYNYPSGTEKTGAIDITTVDVYEVPTAADAGVDTSDCGGTSVILHANIPTVGTGTWSIDDDLSDPGGSVSEPLNSESNFNGVTGNSYVLLWTVSNGTCTSTDSVNVSFPLYPVQPGNFTVSSAIICQGAEDVQYTVPVDPTITTFNWSYSGTGHTIVGTGNSITIDFSTSATNGKLSVTGTNDCGTSIARTLDITVNALPDLTLIVNALFDSICTGSNTEIEINFTAGTGPFNFTITDGTNSQNLNNIAVDPYTFIPLTAPTWIDDGTPDTDYYYMVTTITDFNVCTNTNIGNEKVTVFKIPDTGPQYHISNTWP